MIIGQFIVAILAAAVLFSCAAAPPNLHIKDSRSQFAAGQIVSATTGAPVSFEAMVEDLAACRVVYVGETHTDPIHHQIQHKILEALFQKHPNPAVGMEMFDFTYQKILDRWSQGLLSDDDLLEKTHWYANWRYNFDLYKNILAYIRDNRIPLFGLNIPFHVPPKVRIGGIDSLLGCDRRYLPERIDTTNAAHRAYLKAIFEQHRFHGDADFDFFYQAQCVWEDTMAESIVRNLEDRLMVVLVGNGHIVHKFGIPNRAFHRRAAPFRTVYLARAGETAELSYGDYIWVTPARDHESVLMPL